MKNGDIEYDLIEQKIYTFDKSMSFTFYTN